MYIPARVVVSRLVHTYMSGPESATARRPSRKPTLGSEEMFGALRVGKSLLLPARRDHRLGCASHVDRVGVGEGAGPGTVARSQGRGATVRLKIHTERPWFLLTRLPWWVGWPCPKY
jgi:hypothetical protein